MIFYIYLNWNDTTHLMAVFTIDLSAVQSDSQTYLTELILMIAISKECRTIVGSQGCFWWIGSTGEFIYPMFCKALLILLFVSAIS